MNNSETESQVRQLIGVFTVLADSIYRSTPQEMAEKCRKGEIKTITNLIRTNSFRNLIKSEDDINSPNFRQALLIHLSDCPPFALIEDSSTDTINRIEHWCAVKLKYELLYYSFDSPFSGDKNPYNNLDLDIKRLIDLIRDDYLTLYWVLHDGWDFIEKKIEKSNQPAFKVLKRPGKTFLEIISREMYYEFLVAFPEETLNGGNSFASFSPRQNIKRTIEHEKLKGKEKIGVLSKHESIKLANLEKKIKEIHKRNWGTHLRDFCVSACTNAPDKFTVHRKLLEYRKVNAELWHTVKTLSREASGWAWLNGERLTGNKNGGTYS